MVKDSKTAARLALRFLGDFAVMRDGRVLPLPPSRKTRALLAYLCLQPRRFRREQLSELLWEVPDDPRGSLRWSLSKLRRLIDDEGSPMRVVADRNSVGIDVTDAEIDVRELRALVAAGMASASTEDLESAALRFRGNFLEGLELSDFHDFHAWFAAEREQVLRDRAALLSELVGRRANDPARALAPARDLVGLFPYEEGHRATLIRLLNAARQPAEAEEQFQIGLRMLKEAGLSSSGALVAARRAPRIDAPVSPPVAPPPPLVAAPAVPELIGRDDELTTIATVLREVRDRPRAGLLVLSGAPGIGKTRVLEAVRAMAEPAGARVWPVAAFESDAMRPFSLWTEALLAIGPEAHARVFGRAGDANRERFFTEIDACVQAELAAHPVVLLVDDAHWCDESSVAVLLHVLRMNRARPLLVVLAARADESQDNVALQQALRGLRRDSVLLREIEIGPLAEQPLAALVAKLAPGADGARLGRASGGNPLLAIELARAETAGSRSASLDEWVRERLARLGSAGADVLRWCAVLNPRVEVALLARLSGIDEAVVFEAVEGAQRRAVLRAGSRGLKFAHDLIARAVYHDISPLRRQVMHRRVAEMLERDTAQDLGRAADLARHASLTGDPGYAARALVQAGRLSLRFFANAEAQALARRGLQQSEWLRDSERVCVQIDLHDILLAAGPLQQAKAAPYEALAEKALDHGALAHARLAYQMAATVRWASGHWAAAREQTLQAMRAVRGGDDEAQIVGMAESAKCLAMLERDLPQADAALSEVRERAARRGLHHHAIAAGLGMLRFHEGRLDEAAELFHEARTLCKSAGDRISEFQANEYLLMIELQRGRLDAARERSAELSALGDRLREGSEEPFARALAALCDHAAGDAGDRLDAALADLRVADAKHRLAYVLTRAAMIDCERGQVRLARQRATEALAHASTLERPTEMLLANAVLARDCAATGDPTGTERFAREAERLAGAGAAAWTQDVLDRLAAARAALQREAA